MHKRHRDKDSHTKATLEVLTCSQGFPGTSPVFGTKSPGTGQPGLLRARGSPQPAAAAAGGGCQRTKRCQMSPKVAAEHLCTGAGTGERSFDKGSFAGVTDHYKSLRPPAPSWERDQRHPGLLLEVDGTCFWNLFLQVRFASAQLSLQLEVLPSNLLDMSLAGPANKEIIIPSWQLLTKKSFGFGLWVPSLLQHSPNALSLSLCSCFLWISYSPRQVEPAEGISLSQQPAWHRQGYFLPQVSFYCPALHTHKNRVKTIN